MVATTTSKLTEISPQRAATGTITIATTPDSKETEICLETTVADIILMITIDIEVRHITLFDNINILINLLVCFPLYCLNYNYNG